jgi:hypothetical protein
MSDQPAPHAAAAPAAQPALSLKSVALLLLAVAVIAGGVAYGVASSQVRSTVELKDALARSQAMLQNGEASLAKIRQENTASLASLRAESSAAFEKLRAEQSATLEALRAENAELRSRLAASDSRVATAEAAIAKSRRRDPNAIYQAGVEVGRVSGASEDRAASIVTFQRIEGGNFDRNREFDFRDLVLRVKSHKGALTSFTGRGVQTELTGVEATIVRTRPPP